MSSNKPIMMRNNRIMSEIKYLSSLNDEYNDDDEIIEIKKTIKQVHINETDIYGEHIITMFGPKDTPFENGIFKLCVIMDRNKYPNNPPYVRFITKMYHPNISSHGEICIDILKSQWSPVLRIQHIILSISVLLAEPNPNDPLMFEIATEYTNNRSNYISNVKSYVKKYAIE